MRRVQEETLGARGGRTIAYYQWTPLILLLQALLFYAPCAVWRRVGDNSGIDVGNLIESGQLIASVQMEANVRKKIVRKMVTQVNRSAAAAALPHATTRRCSVQSLLRL